MGLPYSQPSGQGDKFEPVEHNGHLLLFFPIRYNPEETTKFGASTSANTDIIDVDTGKVILDAKVFGNLANSLRNDCGGGVVLGRLGQGVNTKGNPPWILNPFDPTTDPPRADPLLAQYKAGQFKQPAAPAQSSAPASPAANQQYPAPAATAPAAPAQWQAQSSAPVQTGAPQAGWNAPPPAAAPAPPPAPAPAAPAVDPNLVAFLAQRGVTVTPGMDQATCEAIARTFPSPS